MAFRRFLFLGLISVGSVAAVGQARPPMVAPLFPISYDTHRVAFEEAPDLIGQSCKVLRGHKLWLYAKWHDAETDYFIVSGFVVNHPDGPGKGDIEPDDAGIAVALSGSKCVVDSADWVMSGEVDSAHAARLPETFAEALPGHGAPSICDKYGTCHYTVRSHHAQAILDGLASDALERFSKAFGGKQNFLNALQQSVPHLDLVEPVLLRHLEEFRKK